MIFSAFFLFFCICFLYLFDDGKWSSEKRKKSILIFVWLILVVIVTFRPSEMPDYGNYLSIFKSGKHYRGEIGFVKIIQVIRIFTKDPLFLFGIFASVSIAIKLWAISKMSHFVWLSLSIYISNILILHDMIQIRCAVASGLLLVAIKYVYERNLLKFVLVSGIALLFHNSAIIIFPLWFLNIKRPQKRVFILLIPVAYLLAISGQLFGNYAQYLQIESFQRLWYMYQRRMEFGVGNEINIFNYLHIARCLICMFLIYKIEMLSIYNRMTIILVKVYTISLTAFVLLSDIPVMAFRVSELYQVVEILLIPMLVYTYKGHYTFARVIPMIIGLAFLLINTFYLRLLL